MKPAQSFPVEPVNEPAPTFYAEEGIIGAVSRTYAVIGDYVLHLAEEGKLEIQSVNGEAVPLERIPRCFGYSFRDICEAIPETRERKVDQKKVESRLMEVLLIDESSTVQELSRSILHYLKEGADSLTEDFCLSTFLNGTKFCLSRNEEYLIALSPRKERAHIFRVKEKGEGFLEPEEWADLGFFEGHDPDPALLQSIPELTLLMPEMGLSYLLNNGVRIRIKDQQIIAEDEQGELLFSDTFHNIVSFGLSADEFIYIARDGANIVRLSTTESRFGKGNDGEVAVEPQLWLSDAIVSIPFVRLNSCGTHVLAEIHSRSSHSIEVIELETGLSIGKPLFRDKEASRLQCGSDGKIYCISRLPDSSFELMYARSNLHRLGSDSFQDESDLRENSFRLRALHGAESRVSALDLETELEPTADKDCFDPIGSRIEHTKRVLTDKVKGALSDVSDRAGLERVHEKLKRFRTQKEFSNLPDIFDEVNQLLVEKEEQVFSQEFVSDCERLLEELSYEPSREVLLSWSERYDRLLVKRKDKPLTQGQLRKRVQETLQELTEKLLATKEKFFPEAERQVLEALDKIRGDVDTTENVAELEHVKGSRDTQMFRDTLRCFPEEQELQGRQYLVSLEKLFDERMSELEERDLTQEFRKAEVMSDLLEGIASQKAVVKRALEEVNSFRSLSCFRTENATLQELRKRISELPPSYRNEEETKLEVLFNEKMKILRSGRAQKLVASENGLRKFGHVAFPIFPGYVQTSSPRVIPSYQGASEGRLVFEGIGGKMYEVGDSSLPLRMTDPTVEDAIKRYRPEADRYFAQMKRAVPVWQDFWVMNNHMNEILAETALRLKVSLNLQKGLLIQEGEAGCGKTLSYEMFAHLTNRELFEFSCNHSTEKEDLTFAYMYDSKRGTYRCNSELIEAIQTPGALIVFDEINTLPVEVAKMLGPLFDHRRTLGGKRSPASVLFAASMNSKRYIGTKPLPFEIKNRSQIMHVGFPEFSLGGGEVLS